jgi:hypothetical protein
MLMKYLGYDPSDSHHVCLHSKQTLKMRALTGDFIFIICEKAQKDQV